MWEKYVWHADGLLKENLETGTYIRKSEAVVPLLSSSEETSQGRKWFRWLVSPTWKNTVSVNNSQALINLCSYSLQSLIKCNLLYILSGVLWTDILKLSQQQKTIWKFHNGNSVLPNRILFFCYITAVNIFIPIYSLDSTQCVSLV
jgi:hypothetical protein